MKNYLLSCMLLMLSVATALAQADKGDIQKTFEAYFLTLEQKNSEGAMEFAYPRLFELVPREAMQQAIHNMLLDTTTPFP